MNTQIVIAHIPFDSEDENLLSDSKVIAVQGGCFWYDDGFEPRLIPLPTAQWAEVPITSEMAQAYGDYAGLYLPSGEMTTDGNLWADVWGIDLNSLTYSVGFEDEFNQIIVNYLTSLEASKESSKKAKEAWLAGQPKREKAAKIAEERAEEEWNNYLSIKDSLGTYDRYENSDYYIATHGIIIDERTERFYSEGSDKSSSDGMGSRSNGGYVTIRVVTYQLPDGETKTLENPPNPKPEKEWALNHNAGYWSRRKWDIENPPSKKAVEAVPEPEPAPQVSENQKLIEDFGAKFPQLIEKCLSLGIQIKLTSGDERRVVVRSRDLRGYESFPKDFTELHQAVIEAIAFKTRKNELEALEKAKEEQIIEQQKESQLPYKTACEKAGCKVEWNQVQVCYFAKVGKKWTDCRTVCRQKNLPVEFSKKPKLVLKK